jgi:hypothetical protein
MCGVVRVYLEPDERLPESQRPLDWPTVVDYWPDEVRAAVKVWKRRGFQVLMVAL